MKRKRGRPKKTPFERVAKDPDAPKWPGNAYTIYVHDIYESVREKMEKEEAPKEGEAQHWRRQIIAEIGKMWRALSPEEKKVH